MRELMIEACGDSAQIFDEILNNSNFNSESFTIALEDDMIIITINNEEDSCLYTNHIANKIANYILNFVEPRMIRNEVELGCLELLDEEIEEDIAEKVEWEILYKYEGLREEYLSYLQEEIFDGLENQGLFNLSGFLNFRFNLRRLEIKDYVNIALEDYFSDESEEQFVSLIKRIVSIQKSMIDLVHIIFLDQDNCEIITSNNERINLNDVEQIIDEQVHDKTESAEQLHLILTVLMTLVPSKVNIHTNEKQDPYITQMLRKIYGDRILICDGCDFCETIRKIASEENNK